MGKRIDDDPLAFVVDGPVSLDDFYKEDAHKCDYKYPKDCPVCSLADPMAVGLGMEQEAVAQTHASGLRAASATTQNRTEALRAASRVVAGTFTRVMDDIPADDRNITSTTLIVAKQFAKYLETGE